MDNFWSAFGQAIIDKTVWSWAVVGIISGIIGLVLDFTLWRKPLWEGRMKWLKALPFIVFGLLLVMTVTLAMPYNIWKSEQEKLRIEIQKNTDLQKQLSSITKLNFEPLPITNQKVNSPDSVSITVTATPDFNPAYSSTIPCIIQNPDPNNHIFEIVRIKLFPKQFKFTTVDKTKLAPNITVLDDYSGTNDIILVINDFSPLENVTVDFPVYTDDTTTSIRGIERINIEILDSKVLP